MSWLGDAAGWTEQAVRDTGAWTEQAARDTYDVAQDAAPVVREVTENPYLVSGVATLAIVYPPVGVPLATAVASANALARAVEEGDPAAVAQLAATEGLAASGNPDAARYIALVDEAERWGAATGISVRGLPPAEAVVAVESWRDTLQSRIEATRAASRAAAESQGRTAALAEHAGELPIATIHLFADGRMVFA